MNFQIAETREEHEACERNTVGCCVDHVASSEHGCETW